MKNEHHKTIITKELIMSLITKENMNALITLGLRLLGGLYWILGMVLIAIMLEHKDYIVIISSISYFVLGFILFKKMKILTSYSKSYITQIFLLSILLSVILGSYTAHITNNIGPLLFSGASIVFFSAGYILFKKINFFSTFSKYYITAALLLCPIIVFLIGSMTNSFATRNPFASIRIFIMLLPHSTLLILFVFANSLMIYSKLSILYKLLLSSTCYALLIFFWWQIYNIKGHPSYKWIYVGAILMYIVTYIIYRLICKIHTNRKMKREQIA